jgi:oligoribonuclease (3'-5' exoribonuclease)
MHSSVVQSCKSPRSRRDLARQLLDGIDEGIPLRVTPMQKTSIDLEDEFIERKFALLDEIICLSSP